MRTVATHVITDDVLGRKEVGGRDYPERGDVDIQGSDYDGQ